MGPLVLPLIAGGTALAQSAISAISAKRQQKKANEYNQSQWEKQNLYNDPRNQMARLQGANLNPNLIYGSNPSGASGNASPAPEFQRVNDNYYRPVDLGGITNSLQAFTDWDIKKASLDKLRTENTAIQQETLLKIAQQAKTSVETAKSKFELGFAQRMQETSAQALEQNLKKMQADTQYTLNSDERAAIQTTQSVSESVERIIQMRTGNTLTTAQTANIRADYNVKRLDSEFAQKGIRPQDPFWWKTVESLITRLLPNEQNDPNKPWYDRYNPFK